MKYCRLALLALISAMSGGLGIAATYEEQLAGRREEYVKWVADTFGQLEATMDPKDGRRWALNHARIAVNRDLDKASRHFESFGPLPRDRDIYFIRYLRTLLDFRDSPRLSEQAKTHLIDTLRKWPQQRAPRAHNLPAHTENHELMNLTIGMFAEQSRGGDISNYVDWIKQTLAWRLERGWVEFNSRCYQYHYSNPLIILVDYAPDDDLRRSAQALLNVMLAERALLSVNGYLAGPSFRCREADAFGSLTARKTAYLTDARYDGFLPMVWMAFGMGEPRFDFAGAAVAGLEPATIHIATGNEPRLKQDEAMFLACSTFRPHPIVRALAEEAKTRKTLVYKGQRYLGWPSDWSWKTQRWLPGAIYYYNTPHISMGSVHSDGAILQSRYNTILFGADPSRGLRVEVVLPDVPPNKRRYETRGRVVQHRSWMLGQGTLFEDGGIKARKVGRWNLYRVGKGLCAHRELGAHRELCAHRELGDSYHVLQVSDLDTFAGEEAFVAALAVPKRTGNQVEAVTLNGDRVAVDLTKMSIAINGTPRPHPPKMLHDCEAMESEYGSGKITIKTKAGSVTFDSASLHPIDGCDFNPRVPGNMRARCAHVAALGSKLGASKYRTQLAERRQEYLAWIVDKFSQLEPTMKPLDGRGWSLNQARLFLGKDTDKANRYFETIKLTRDPDFMGIRLLKTLLDFGASDRLSSKAKEHLTTIIKNWPMGHSRSRMAKWPPEHTENHDLMYLTLGLFSEKLRGKSIEKHLSEVRKSLFWRYERGFYEWGSHRYQLHYSNPLQILAEHAPAPDVRRGAEALFNIMLAERALMSVNGYLGGPGMRSYDRNRGCDYLDNNRYDSFLPTVWIALGVSEPRFDFSQSGGLGPAGDGYGNGRDPRLNQDEAIFLATNHLVPHPVVRELLDEVSQRPELVYVGRRASAGHPFQNAVPSNPRSHQVVYYYNTPHISMGSLQYLPYAGKMSVSYNSRPRFFSIMFPEKPSQVLRTRLSDKELSGKDKYAYTADRVVQHRNWLIAAGELSASHGLTSRRIDGWDVFRVGQGLCAHVELQDGWHVFQVSDLKKYRDEKSFVAALSVPTIKDGKARGVTTNGDKVSVDLETMSITINGVLRKPQVEMLHNSPLMKSKYGSGKITITTERNNVTFDGTSLRPEPIGPPKLPQGMTRWGNPSSEGPTTRIAHTRAMGGLSPACKGMRLKSVSIFLPSNNSGQIRLAVYAGGTLDGGPHAGTPARLLYDFGKTSKKASGWVTLEHPQSGTPLPANTPVWIAWKGTGGLVNVTYQESASPADDFQTGHGRWDSKAIDSDQSKPWPKTWPADTQGSFEDYTYSVFLTHE